MEVDPGEGKEREPLTNVKGQAGGAELKKYCLPSRSACLYFGKLPQDSHTLKMRIINTYFTKS